MELAVDASSIINLSNAGALGTVVQLQHCNICVSPLVVGECEPTCAAELKELSDNGQIKFVELENIPADLFLELLSQHNLGEGETECIALCAVTEHHFCCDDNKARQVAAERIGEHRVLGSMRLLRWCVVEGLASSEEAFAIYQQMKSAGGFLPEVAVDFFVGDDF